MRTVAFDADDTLWHNERFFKLTQAQFADLLRDYAAPEALDQRLMEAERRNIGHYGFGVKGFTLSMIETALEVTEHRVPGSVIREIMEVGREMLAHPIELLPHVEATLTALAETHFLMVVTKGDLLHQERKVAQSGLGELFDAVEVVSDKTPEIYTRLFEQVPGGARGTMMVGNSMKSDVRPAILAGAWGVFVPHEHAWDFESAEAPDHPRFAEIADLSELPPLVAGIG
ncbi:HAD family hydrolase [Roseivivax lentus]|uniref:HAD family hydrolase n=1 Tax=Roseivivax lentus TaxID=633194 RepID=UPI0038998F5A